MFVTRPESAYLVPEVLARLSSCDGRTVAGYQETLTAAIGTEALREAGRNTAVAGGALT